MEQVSWVRWGVRFTATPAETKLLRPRALSGAGDRAPGGEWQARGWRGRWIRMGGRVQLVGRARHGTVDGFDAGRVRVSWDDGGRSLLPAHLLRSLPHVSGGADGRDGGDGGDGGGAGGRGPGGPGTPGADGGEDGPSRPRAGDLIPDHDRPWNQQEAEAGLRELIETRTYRGYTLKVTEVDSGTFSRASGGGKYLRFKATFHAPDGQVAGETTRRWIRERDGTLWAEHELQQLEPQHRGNHLAAEWAHHLEELYRESGFDRIELFASLEDGGYVWASAGFDFAETWSAQAVIDQLRVERDRLIAVRDGWAGDPEDPALEAIMDDIDLAEELLNAAQTGFGTPNFPSAYMISQAGRKKGMNSRTDEWLGKRVMRGSEWEGVKYL